MAASDGCAVPWDEGVLRLPRHSDVHRGGLGVYKFSFESQGVLAAAKTPERLKLIVLQREERQAHGHSPSIW